MWNWHTEALKAYEEHSRRAGVAPTDSERDSWVEAWRRLEEEYREAALEAYWDWQRQYFKDGV
jgi:hypothetical protein